MDGYGINQALINGNNESQELRQHNEGVIQHNKQLLTNYNTAENTRKEKSTIDDIWHGVSDPAHSMVAMYHSFQTGSKIADAGYSGIGDYIQNDIKDRMGNIKTGMNTLTGGSARPIDGSLGGDVLSSADKDNLTRLNTLGAGEESKQVWADTPQADKDLLIKTRNFKTGKPNLGGAAAEEEGGNTGAGKLAENLAGKYGLKGPQSKVIGAVAGKALGIAGGIEAGIQDITEADGTWAKENNVDKTANVLSMVGAGLDAVGAFVPILEPLGLIATAAAGITGLVGDVKDSAKQHSTNVNTLNTGTEAMESSKTRTALTTSGATQQKSQNYQGQASF